MEEGSHDMELSTTTDTTVPSHRAILLRRALFLEILTVGWNLIEGAEPADRADV